MKIKLLLLLFCLLGIGIFSHAQDRKKIQSKPKVENGADAIPVTVKSTKKVHRLKPPPPPAPVKFSPPKIVQDKKPPPPPPRPKRAPEKPTGPASISEIRGVPGLYLLYKLMLNEIKTSHAGFA